MIAILLKALTAVIMKLLASLASQELLEWALFKLAETISASTATPHDDEWVAKIKEAYQKQDDK